MATFEGSGFLGNVFLMLHDLANPQVPAKLAEQKHVHELKVEKLTFY